VRWKYYIIIVLYLRHIYRGWNDTMAASRATNYLCIVRVMCFYARESGKWPKLGHTIVTTDTSPHEIGRTDAMYNIYAVDGMADCRHAVRARVCVILLLLFSEKKFITGEDEPRPDT